MILAHFVQICNTIAYLYNIYYNIISYPPFR